MKKIISLPQAFSVLSSHKNKGQTIVLTGGCFDIIHFGHVKFLEESKSHGDILVIMLESDEKVKTLKGKSRPLFSQKERARVLSAFSFTDYVILLPYFKTDKEYSNLIKRLRPSIITVTESDPLIALKKQQTLAVEGKLTVIPKVKTYSSSQLAKIVGLE